MRTIFKSRIFYSYFKVMADGNLANYWDIDPIYIYSQLFYFTAENIVEFKKKNMSGIWMDGLKVSSK
jgi:hypothetical protein